MSANFFWVLLYFVLIIGLGTILIKKHKGAADFLVAKKNLTTALIIPLLFAEAIAGAGTIGNAADAFKYGISSVWVNWGMSIGVILMIFTVAKFFKVAGDKYGIISVPAGYELRFDKKTRLVMMGITVIVYIILFALQPISAAAILAPMTGLSIKTVTLIIGVLFIYLAITGGMKGLAWQNVVHSMIMYVGVGLVAFYAVKTSGGLGHMQAVLPASFFSLSTPDLFTVTGWSLGTALGAVCSSTGVAVIYGGKSWKSVRNGCLWAAGLVFIFALLPALIGMAGKIAMPAVQGKSILYVMANSMGSYFGVFAAMGVLAAIMSTAPAILLLLVTVISRDFYKLFKPDISDAEEMKFARIACVVVGLIATVLGLGITSILAQVAGAFQIRAIAGLVLVIALFWPRVDSRAAFWSMLLGGGVAFVWHIAGNPYVTSLWPALAVCIPVLVVLTLMAKEPVYEKHAQYLEDLKELEARNDW